MSDQEPQAAEETPKIVLRREVVERFGSFRVDRELFRISTSDGPWREYHRRYVILEGTPLAEFEVGGASAQAVEDLAALLRWLRSVLERLAPALVENTTRRVVYGPWTPRLAAEDAGYPKQRPHIGLVTQDEAATQIAAAIAELERTHPELRADPEGA